MDTSWQYRFSEQWKFSIEDGPCGRQVVHYDFVTKNDGVRKRVAKSTRPATLQEEKLWQALGDTQPKETET